jgi:hypothetical protein
MTENEIADRLVRRLPPLLVQRFKRDRPDLERSPRLLAFGCLEPTADERLANSELPFEEGHVPPAESQQFAAAHPGSGRNRHKPPNLTPVRPCCAFRWLGFELVVGGE